MTLSEFKKIIAAWPDHEDAEVWVETDWGVTNYVTKVLRLNEHDICIRSKNFEPPVKKEGTGYLGRCE